MGGPQVISLPAAHPGSEGVAFPCERAAAGGVQRDPGDCRIAEVPAVACEGGRVFGVMPGGAGSIGGVVEGKKRVDGLLRPGHVPVRPRLGNCYEFAQDVGVAQGTPGCLTYADENDLPTMRAPAASPL